MERPSVEVEKTGQQSGEQVVPAAPRGLPQPKARCGNWRQSEAALASCLAPVLWNSGSVQVPYRCFDGGISQTACLLLVPCSLL